MIAFLMRISVPQPTAWLIPVESMFASFLPVDVKELICGTRRGRLPSSGSIRPREKRTTKMPSKADDVMLSAHLFRGVRFFT
jgi:hypothetical protein